MKVLHVLNEIRYSGAEVMLYLSAPYFKKENVELHAVAVGEEIGEYAVELENAGFKVHFVEFQRPNMKSGLMESFRLFNKFKEFLKNEQFDIVHIHRESAFSLFAAAAKLAGVKSIFRTVHNVFFVFEGSLRLRKKIERHVAKNLFGVKYLTIGDSVRDVEKEFYNLDSVIIPNWIDNSVFLPGSLEEKSLKRTEVGLDIKDLVLISVGRTTVEKNHIDIIEILPELIKRFPNLKYIHVGDGDQQEKLKERVEELEVSENVEFLGKRKDVRDLVIASDIFLMPSKYEGLGNSLLEALFCGIPAIIYNVYGLRDLIENNKNGLVVEPNQGELKEAILKLAGNDKLRVEMGERAALFAKEQYDMEKSLGKLLDNYKMSI